MVTSNAHQRILMPQSSIQIINFIFLIFIIIEMQDQITCTFIFRITPTQIKQNLVSGKQPNNAPRTTQQSILFKLGTSEGKCKSLNDTIQIKTAVLFSKTLNKFCPIKGLIKIYDKNRDGTEMISCVGAFNTDQLINTQHNQISGKYSTNDVELIRNVGPCSLVMKVSVSKQEPFNSQLSENRKEIKKSEITTPQPSKTNSNDKQLRPFSKTKNSARDNPLKPAKQQIRTSSSGLSYGTTEEEYQKQEYRILGQQLVEQRRIVRSLEQKNNQSQHKNKVLSQRLNKKYEQLSQFVTKLKSFTEMFNLHQVNLNLPKEQLIVKYNKNKENPQKHFSEFITYFRNKIIEHETNRHSNKDSADIDSETRLDTISLNTTQLSLKQKQKRIYTLEQTILKKNQQILILQKKINKHLQEAKTLEGINQYLQEKDSQMESIIAQKQSQIESLKKVITANHQQLDLYEDKNIQQQRIIENLELTIQETKEEVDNLSETIQNYRKKYGDLKDIKDRALQRDLRECLHWIDQYRTEEELSEMGEQTTNNSIHMNMSNSNINVDSDNSMTSLMMKSIDHIEEMPLEEISHIRRQVVNVLKRLDQFLSRNAM